VLRVVGVVLADVRERVVVVDERLLEGLGEESLDERLLDDTLLDDRLEIPVEDEILVVEDFVVDGDDVPLEDGTLLVEDFVVDGDVPLEDEVVFSVVRVEVVVVDVVR